MGKNSWIALLLTLVVLVTTVPVCAAGAENPGVQAYREEDYGGLAPDPVKPPKSPSRPAGEGDNGGIAPTTGPAHNPSNRPAGEGDNGGIAPTPGLTPSAPGRPAGEGDNGGIAPTPGLTPSAPGRPAGEEDNGGIAPTPGPAHNPSNRPAGEGDNGGVAPDQPSSPVKRKNLPSGKIVAGVSLSSSSHTAYAQGSSGLFPSFSPTRQVTRAEAAQMLYRLLPEQGRPASAGAYADVPEGAWYAKAVTTLADLGVLEAQDGMLDTGRPVTRGEFTRYIACFFPLRTDGQLFPDVDENDPNAPFIRSAQAYGWAQGGSDGLFHPDDTISRAAAVVLLNRALGRTADRAYIDQNHPAFYVDVAPSSWYYYDVCEAAIPHRHTDSGSGEQWTSHTARTAVPKDGLQMADGWLYCYDAARGDVVREATVGTHYFNSSGRFTTGNNELDSWLRKIVLARTVETQTQEQKLRALYLYTRDSFTYLRRPPYEMGVYDYMETDALRILETGYGNCYCYAALFWYLSRWIGYDATIYNGTVGVRRSPHSWVEISLNGKAYIFDTELEMAYRRKKRFDVNLYKFYDAGNSWNYRRPQQGGAQM
nr:S-layer homology domain-containing protein [uncultured Oscillibacter sp.]